MSEIGNEIERIYSELLEKKKVFEESVGKAMRLEAVEREYSELKLKEKENGGKFQLILEEVEKKNL